MGVGVKKCIWYFPSAFFSLKAESFCMAILYLRCCAAFAWRGPFAYGWISVNVLCRTLLQSWARKIKSFSLPNSRNSNKSSEEISPCCPVYILWPSLLFSPARHLQKEFICPFHLSLKVPEPVWNPGHS